MFEKENRAKMKKLGQNFLIDATVAGEIIRVAELANSDTVLEIGPGKGVLTELLVQKTKKVIAIEKDSELAGSLQARFGKKVEVIVKDIRDVEMKDLFCAENARKEEYTVIANLPYYAGTHIVKTLISCDCQPKKMIVMLQKEVAERMCAEPPGMSYLGCFVQYFSEAEILFDVSAKSFSPKPEVTSSVMEIMPKNISNDTKKSRDFLRLIECGFQMKRKTLLNNLAKGFGLQKRIVEKIIQKEGLDLNIRPQELALEKWLQLLSNKELASLSE